VGQTGPTGPAGQDGTDGSNGVTFTPAVSSAGVISWTNDGGLPNPQSVNIKGPQGETGATGPAGPGVPSGGSTGQVLTKTGAADYATGWQDPSGGDVTADMLGIVIDGNSTPVGASAGQYVIVKNSTINGITDGLYKAAKVIPASTMIDSTYLTGPIAVGGLNDLLASTPLTTLFDDTHRQISYLTYPALKLLFVYVNSDETTYTASDHIDFTATLPSTIVPIVATSAVTRKHGFVTVSYTKEITFRLMKDQIWDQGYVIVPYL
jgi:hypothetical protein